LSGVLSFYGGSGRYARPIQPSPASPEPSSLSTRLAEIDRRLREIQAQLAPDREPAPAFTPPAPSGGDAELAEPELDTDPESPRRGREGPLAAVLASGRAHNSAQPDPREAASDPVANQIEQLAELQTSLLSSMTDVLAGFHRALAQLEADGREITISAGPFGTLDALREFERRLSALTGVGEVTVRGYEGDDRAVIDVRLDGPTT
jgi:hypothetical protein